ncbi:MAG: sulfur oxidation c-type cytochrome SoxX [Gammaproteobacteria bacterium]
MLHTARTIVSAACSIAVMTTAMALAPVSSASAETALEKGKALSFDRKLGNCLACHAMDDGELAGNIGPPLVSMKLRFPDKTVLRAQIWDATVKNSNTIMPPFGRHNLLTEEQIDLITDYVYSL